MKCYISNSYLQTENFPPPLSRVGTVTAKNAVAELKFFCLFVFLFLYFFIFLFFYKLTVFIFVEFGTVQLPKKSTSDKVSWYGT